eukprot:NODE_391_length_8148_cov_0.393838.p3 type:complete len:286 gc:universal NODE_391_length_8148_cov_0.393838:5984-5127(-)
MLQPVKLKMELPRIGFGTYQLKNVKSNVRHALEIGYKHIDTAHFYQNENAIGLVLKDFKREELFVTSKLWCTDHFRVEEAFKESLDDLQLDYIDLYLIHWPISRDKNGEIGKGDLALNLVQTWKEMEKLVEKKLVRYIGVSNFSISHLKDILAKCKIKPYANQFEIHPYCFPRQLISFCKSEDIKVIAYGSLGASECDYFNNPLLQQVATNYKMSISQVLLSWAYSKGIYVIPKSNTKSRIDENFQIKEIDTSLIDGMSNEKFQRVYDPLTFFGVDIFGDIDRAN